MLNVWLDAPAGTVRVVGTLAFALFDVNERTKPFGPAAPFNVTVPDVTLPPITEDGETETADSTAGVTVRTAVAEDAFRLAVKVTVVEVETAEVVMANVAEVAPAET